MSKEYSIAVFDLTDCEGCELQFLSLRDRLNRKGKDFQVANWRLLDTAGSPGPYDVTFIEGSPITEADIETIKLARAVSKKIVALGTCAVLGGVQAAIPKEQREKYLKEIYGKNYKVKTRAPKPLSYYIDVDIDLPGCPINPDELEMLLSNLFIGKDFKEARYPVCLECKARGNTCLFVEDGFCLGPVTKGGCGAPCPAAGLRCYGCFGPTEGANLEALHNVAGEYADEKYIKDQLELYFKNHDSYKEFKLKKK
jgi:sulfhydrogenase subunit delta